MIDRRTTFFTSDWHIGHNNVIKYSNRPFKDVDHMARILINNFNSTVPKTGITYFLGDMGFTQGDALKNVVSQLNGLKILILGNHDKGVEAMYKQGFDAVMYGATLFIAGQIVTLSHCPLLGIWREDMTKMEKPRGTFWHGDDRNQKFSTVDRGQFHLHGHVHSPNGGRSEKILNKQYDVGVDANGFRPVSISTIESWIATYGK